MSNMHLDLAREEQKEREREREKRAREERERDERLIREEREDDHRTYEVAADLHKIYYETASKSAETSVKTSIIVNGGGALGVLGFLNGLVGKDIVDANQISEISTGLIWFAAGVASGVMSLALIYLMNYCTAINFYWRHSKLGITAIKYIYYFAHTTAVLSALLSISLFVVGMLDVRNSITRIVAGSPTQGVVEIPETPRH